MTTKARVFEGTDLDHGRGIGEYHFASIPSPGDRIVVPAVTSDLDIMEVLYVEHYPRQVTDDKMTEFQRKLIEDKEPWMIVYVRSVGRDTGGS